MKRPFKYRWLRIASRIPYGIAMLIWLGISELAKLLWRPIRWAGIKFWSLFKHPEYVWVVTYRYGSHGARWTAEKTFRDRKRALYFKNDLSLRFVSMEKMRKVG